MKQLNLDLPGAMLVADPEAILREAIDRYEPSLVVAALSGGRDSIPNAFITAQHPRFAGVLLINTGIGIEETREFVRYLAKHQGWPLFEYHALEYIGRNGKPMPQDYQQLVLEAGMPGPALHQKFYDRLKGRPFAQFVREHKRSVHDRIMITTGIRKQESSRRMRLTRPVQRQGALVWCNPIFYWSQWDRNDYSATYDLPTTRASELLGISGECLCGCFGSAYEKQLIRRYFPGAAEQIARAEAGCRQRGVWDRWGEKPPRGCQARPKHQRSFLPFCVGCAIKDSADEDEDDALDFVDETNRPAIPPF